MTMEATTPTTHNEIYPGVTVSQDTMGGVPVIKGTRVPVEIILGSMAAGETAESLRYNYDLTDDQLRAALGYAAHVIETERVYVVS
ncbi:MAG TPA: DUF433 domain-containing protein [Ktedonobacterales bacterium]|nr:DUF433 domain-containing protein [Ktedonobacterales bacterium]